MTVLVLASCAADDPSNDRPPGGSPSPDPEPSAAIDATILTVEGWWEYAGGLVGVAFDDPATRELVVADVAAACRFLTAEGAVPADFASYVAELDRIAGANRELADRTIDVRSYAVALDAAIHLVCPSGVATLDPIRPVPPGIELDDNIRGSTVIVPDPDPGDLRVDARADVLPVDYRHPDPPRVVLDLAFGDDPAQRIDIYLPARDDAPLVAFLHSGGWVGGDKRFVHEFVLRLVEAGYAVASVGYRLAPEHPFPAPVRDVKHAIRWLKAYGAREGAFDGERIVLMGASAGGHLAAFAAATPGRYRPADLDGDEAAHDDRVVGVVSIVAPTDLVDLYATPHPWAASLTAEFLGCEVCTEAQLREASPLTHVGSGLPPAYWAYGEDDELVRAAGQGVAIASAWGEAGGRYSSWLDLVDGRGHNLSHATINQRWLEAFIAFATSPELPALAD